MPPGLESLLDCLIRHEVEFVVVGGFAAVAHGVTLLTQDIDICCRFTPDNLMRLQGALSSLQPVHRMPTERPPLQLIPETADEFQNLYLETAWEQLDCLGEVLGVGGYDEVVGQSIEVQLSGDTGAGARAPCMKALPPRGRLAIPRWPAMACPRLVSSGSGAGAASSRDRPMAVPGA